MVEVVKDLVLSFHCHQVKGLFLKPLAYGRIIPKVINWLIAPSTDSQQFVHLALQELLNVIPLIPLI